MTYKLGIMNGDDIGLEVVPEAVRVGKAALAAAGVAADWSRHLIGMEAHDAHGTTMPEGIMDTLRGLDGWILGPIGHRAYPKDDPKAINPHPIIRKRFEMYSSLRIAKTFPNVKSLHENVDIMLVRENTEGFQPDRNMFMGNGEFRPTEDLTLSMRVITRKNSWRIARDAFEVARRRGKHVTAVHKETVFKLGCGMFAEECRKVAADYPDVAFDEVMVDSYALHCTMKPQQFDVVVTTNMFGDIMADLHAGLTGGMGLAAAISASETHVMAQASHGSAPDIAGQGIANPYAEIMSMQMMFDWLGRKRNDDAMARAAALMLAAVEKTIAEAKTLTPDLGGSASTSEMGAAIAEAVGA
jgi:3-isopropylmalate dehydrogenase